MLRSLLPAAWWASAYRILRAGLAAAVGLCGLASAAPPAVQLTEVVRGFSLPVDIRFAPGVANRMFVVQQGGRIRIAQGNQILATDFLDLTPIVLSGGERGLLGLAFHPDYVDNRAFYVHYTALDGAVTIARYLRHPTNPDIADPASGAVLLSIPHNLADNHNGGGLQFHSDGTLYITVGDGGDGGDPWRNGQSPAVRLGKMLRIAVDGGTGYTIPAGNMFPAGGTCATTGCPEILHIGLRNAWRFSFDKLNDDLYIGDVGEDLVEEIEFREAGLPPANFGWGVYEGIDCYNDTYFSPAGGACMALSNHAVPIHTYLHDSQGGVSVTGGHVYRGTGIPGLGGFYLYADYVSARLWAGRVVNGTWQNFSLAPLSLRFVSTFGQDPSGEVYVADHVNGRIYRFDPADPNADADSDGVPNGVEVSEGLNPYVKDNDIFTVPRLFAMQQYRDFLGREGEPAGIQFYVNRIANGTVTREQVIESFLSAPEFVNGLPPIIRLYFSFFSRIPDYPGLLFQVSAFRLGTPLELIAQNFANSPEFTNTYGALTNDQYINLVYRNVLGREPDLAGYDYYFTRLESGALTKGQMMIGFSESPEFQQMTDNEAWTVSVYVGLLRRTPEPAGLDFYVNLLDGGTPRSAIIPGFFNSPEYHNRFLPP